TRLGVNRQLGGAVVSCRGRGQHLHGKVRRTRNPILLDDAGARIGNENKVRLQYRFFTQAHVQGSLADLAHPVLKDVRSQTNGKILERDLVPRCRSRSHMHLSIHELIALPVGRKLAELLESQLGNNFCAHTLIIPPRGLRIYRLLCRCAAKTGNLSVTASNPWPVLAFVAPRCIGVCSAWEASALATGRSSCATHGLFVRAFSTASGFLSITVK